MPNKKIIIFIGLSETKEKAKEIIDADYRPPVKRNDILKALNDKPDIIGIIDGVFHQYPAVSHKEIMKALDMGVTVVGGSSMGALRASELDELGMIGIGYVYENYKNGNITSDDDVAVSFDKESQTLLSEALVNIDYKLEKAVDENIISPDTKKHIIKTAKEIYYPKRTYYKIFNDANLDNETKNKLTEFITRIEDIKTQDAIQVLEYIKKLDEEG